MTRAAFEKIVREALRALPKRFRDKLQNVDVVIEDEAPADDPDLLGLYEGVPLNDRTVDYGMQLPDKITLYRRNIEEECRETGTDLRTEIRHTIEHEIAHHFGMTDDDLEEGDIY